MTQPALPVDIRINQSDDPTQETDGAGNVIKDTYNGEDQLLTEQVFAPGASVATSTSSESYDGAGRVAKAVDGNGNYKVETYDGDSRPLTEQLYSPNNTLIANKRIRCLRVRESQDV